MTHPGLLMGSHTIQTSNTSWYTEWGFTVVKKNYVTTQIKFILQVPKDESAFFMGGLRRTF